MSQTSRRPRSFPFRRAGFTLAAIPLDPTTAINALSAANALRPHLEMPLYAHDPARLHLRSSQPASVTSTIEVGAGVNPHSTRCPTGAKLPATSCLGASRTPTASVRGASRHVGVRETYTRNGNRPEVSGARNRARTNPHSKLHVSSPHSQDDASLHASAMAVIASAVCSLDTIWPFVLSVLKSWLAQHLRWD